MVHDQPHLDGGAAKHGDGDGDMASFRDPLPAGTEQSYLGQAADWPETLRAYSVTIASFAYPAAIFYGDEFAILHNQAWADLTGVHEQGRKQRGKLSADLWDALSAAYHGGKPRRIEAKHLLRIGASEDVKAGVFKPVLLSPLFDSEGDDVAGLLAQLIPRKPQHSQATDGADDTIASKTPERATSPRAHVLDTSELGSVVDGIPLDEHPFFHRFAEMIPSGLAILDHRAQAVFVNQLFYQLTTHHDQDKAFKSWPQSIHPEDYDRVMAAYQEAFASQKQLRTEFRAIVETNPWRLLLLTPLGDENLRHVSLREYGGFICSIVDISSEKSAELSERKAAKEARERKEQQERFIDMISHEIRNPLSAILHCTEDIADVVKKPKQGIDVGPIHEALDTIELCISHQRNIVDDVLSFSKLDASMLSLDPKSCRPSTQLANSLKMFQPEFRRQAMEFSYCVDTSYMDHNIDFVMADMARVGQIVVNLVSNAIKFTAKKEGDKGVTVSVGASQERPTSYPPNVVYFNSDDLAFRMDATGSNEWGNGQALYIMVAVKDTGIGINEDGQRRLFERFRQATPKTAELYGGSGLGLNISRKLCHLHGGEIGVSSKEGSGSTFGFFFKVKRADAPKRHSIAAEEDEVIESEELKSQVRALGNLTGTAREEENDAPESIKSPPVVDSQESTPYPDGSKDERYQKTLKVASHVKEPEADVYANSARPKISKEHRTGSHLQSEEISETTEEKTGRNESDNTAAQASAPRQHVLLVEDNIINQRIVFRKLEAKGFNVTTSNNGREAVEAVRDAPCPSSGDKTAFAVVLMDQEMPVLDGNSATQEIRAMEKEGVIEHVPIIGLTANVRSEQLQEMLDSGMDDVISKPYKIEDLVKKIGKITNGGKEK